MIHLHLQPLAERTPPHGALLLRLREGDVAHAVAHAVLLHHGVGHARHLAKVVLGPCWGDEAEGEGLSGERGGVISRKGRVYQPDREGLSRGGGGVISWRGRGYQLEGEG